jgi:hypothetical protein
LVAAAAGTATCSCFLVGALNLGLPWE